MRQYLAVYKVLMKLNFSALTAYRANLLNNSLSAIAWGGFQIITILILTSKVPSIFGWSRVELIILTACFNIFIGIYHTLFSRNFERFSQIVHFGQLDPILVKPIDSQFLSTMWLVNFSGLLRLIIAIPVLVFVIYKYGIEINVLNILGFLSLLPFSLIILYSVWLLVITLTIWFTRLSNLVELLYSANAFSRFPKEMFDNLKNIIIYLVMPLTLVVSTPTKILLNKPFLGDLILLFILTFLLFIISRSFWKFALKYYSSTGS